MKTIVLFLLLALPFLTYAQITFEEVIAPDDFNFSEIRQSPQGEYFVQAGNDNESIYTSIDGAQWTKASLPTVHPLEDIQFFSDGTPLLISENYEHLIRRNGIWNVVHAGSDWHDVTGSFIKDDSLFVFQGESFYYSVDKAQSFKLIFTFEEGIVDHTAHLWKLGEYFALHHSAGASDFLSVFNRQGDRLLHKTMDIFPDERFIYNECGEVLILDRDNYYLFREAGFQFVSGNTEDITSQIESDFYMTSRNGHYYLRHGSIIFKTTGCNFNWTTWKNHDEIDVNKHIWISDQEDIFLNKANSDHYLLQKSASATWDKKSIAINYPRIIEVEESLYERQALQTSTALFTKSLSDQTWTELPISIDSILDIGYSPDGRFYILKPDMILSSSDNGHSFTEILLPPGVNLSKHDFLEVLSDRVLFLDEFYSKDNGSTWIQVGLNNFTSLNTIKLAGDYILVAGSDIYINTNVIDVSSGLVTSSFNDAFGFLFYTYPAILDDGTVYFTGSDLSLDEMGILLQYRLGEGYSYLGNFPELENIYKFVGSGQELFGLGATEYYFFNGESFDAYPYLGLPSSGGIGFQVAKDEHLYAIHENNRIFRSTKPLTSPKVITGAIVKDANQDCNETHTETGLDYWKVKIEGPDYMNIKSTDAEGRFRFNVPDGNYTVSTQPVTSNWTLCETQASITVDEFNPLAALGFQAQALNECATLEIDFSTPRLRRCFENYYQVRVRNTGPANSEGTIVTIDLDPYFEFISATIPWTVVSQGVLEFDLGALTVNEEVTFRIDFKISCDAELGQEHCLKGSVYDPVLCDLTRSYYEECQENIGSYDPNDKRMFNEAGLQTDRIDKGEYIQYHIRFQNTGTDTAFDVRVQDPLSPLLDLSTFEMLSASHPYTYEITDGPDLLVKFENILLPDSTTNEPASNGFFKFRIKPRAELEYGATIPNEADIYFDFNEPVLTGKVTLLLSPASHTHEAIPLLDFDINPNPVDAYLLLHIATADQLRIGTYEIVDFLGRTVISPAIYTSQRIAVGHLGQGMYSVVLKDQEKVVGVKTFVKS